jgi:eukaryotic-like serine/threonine-protein kinase
MGDRGRLTAQGTPMLTSGACDRSGSGGDAGPLAGDRYELGPLLGRGGSGEVYRGFDRKLRRYVAIKVLYGGQGPGQAARFEREVMLLARLQHPNLVPLYDAALGDGRRYLVMPLIRGTTLAERIAAGALPQDEAQRIGSALAQALAYVHTHDVVHRDVKPSNVLLGHGKGQVFLADFGIARSNEGDQTLTAPGQLTGTAAYLAPEQVEGGETGPGCDVYALGLVLLEALTGLRAFPGTLLEQALARLWRQPAIPLSLESHWVRLLYAMTARDPAQRPDCASITVLLHRLTNPGPVATTTLVLPVTPAAPQPAAGLPARRRKPVSRGAAAALSACLLAVGAATTTKSSQDSATPAPRLLALSGSWLRDQSELSLQHPRPLPKHSPPGQQRHRDALSETQRTTRAPTRPRSARRGLRWVGRDRPRPSVTPDRGKRPRRFMWRAATTCIGDYFGGLVVRCLAGRLAGGGRHRDFQSSCGTCTPRRANAADLIAVCRGLSQWSWKQFTED